jgi:3-dehydroquinate synthase
MESPPKPRRLVVEHATGSYPVLVGEGALAAAQDDSVVRQLLQDRAAFVVSSREIFALHGERLDSLLGPTASRQRLEVADGEAAKCSAELVRLWEAMLAGGGKRDSVVVAFGGGSIGDLAGFAAGTFLRGVDLLQVPTTLLAQVDSSVGGKTGIDLPAAKNSVGAFVQPGAVVADTSLLETLPPAELRSGFVETVKMAALLDGELFARIEREAEAGGALLAETFPWLVAGSVEMKAAVVQADPFERGPRKLLNFGHTFAHALETATGYEALRHGEAVAYGLLFALELAAELRDAGETPSLLADDLAPRLTALLTGLDLPPLPELAVGDVLAAMRRDKKARQAGLTWVLPERLGRGVLVEGVAWERVDRLAERFLGLRGLAGNARI